MGSFTSRVGRKPESDRLLGDRAGLPPGYHPCAAVRSLDHLLAGMESTSGEAGRQIPSAVRRRQSGDGANTAQQFAGREPQFTAAQLLHAASSPGWFLLELAAVLLEPSAVHAQPTRRTERQKPAGIDDRPRPSALANAAGPRATCRVGPGNFTPSRSQIRT